MNQKPSSETLLASTKLTLLRLYMSTMASTEVSPWRPSDEKRSEDNGGRFGDNEESFFELNSILDSLVPIVSIPLRPNIPTNVDKTVIAKQVQKTALIPCNIASGECLFGIWDLFVTEFEITAMTAIPMEIPSCATV